MNGRYALVVGNTDYSDPGLARLMAPGKDARDFARVLQSKDICGFDDVQVLLNQPEPVVREAIEALFDDKKPDDLSVAFSPDGNVLASGGQDGVVALWDIAALRAASGAGL